MTLGDKLLELRKQNKMTQEEVADKLKITRQTISNWELNQTKPDLDQAKALSKLYMISLDELVGNDNKELLTAKISNTEKLAGLIIIILKWIGIGIIVFPVLIVFISFILYTTFKTRTTEETIDQWTEVTLNCTLNKKDYTYGIKYSENNRIIEHGGDSYLINILDLDEYEYADQIIDKITNYFEVNGGSCKQ